MYSDWHLLRGTLHFKDLGLTAENKNRCDRYATEVEPSFVSHMNRLISRHGPSSVWTQFVSDILDMEKISSSRNKEDQYCRQCLVTLIRQHSRSWWEREKRQYESTNSKRPPSAKYGRRYKSLPLYSFPLFH